MVDRVTFVGCEHMTQAHKPTATPPHLGIRIRPATLQDIQAVVAHNEALARETEGKQLESTRLQQGVKTVFDHPEHGFYLVAEEATTGTVIGQLFVTYEWSDWRNGIFWWLQSVYVHESWRRRGVFRQLYHYVIEEARNRKNIVGVRLYVEKENLIAQQVYRKIGLLPAGYHVYELDFVLSHSS